MGRPKGSRNRIKTLVEFQENKSMSTEQKTVKNYLGEDVTVTPNADKVTSGTIVETFKIKVKDKDDESKVHYENAEEPFTWNKVEKLSDVINSELGKEENALTEELTAFLGEALSTVPIATGRLVSIYNAYVRGNAKQNAYQTVTNKMLPLTDERRQTAYEDMVTNFSRLNNVTKSEALKTLQGFGVIPAEVTLG